MKSKIKLFITITYIKSSKKTMRFTDSIFFKRTIFLIQMKMESDGRGTYGMN